MALQANASTGPAVAEPGGNTPTPALPASGTAPVAAGNLADLPKPALASTSSAASSPAPFPAPAPIAPPEGDAPPPAAHAAPVSVTAGTEAMTAVGSPGAQAVAATIASLAPLTRPTPSAGKDAAPKETAATSAPAAFVTDTDADVGGLPQISEDGSGNAPAAAPATSVVHQTIAPPAIGAAPLPTQPAPETSPGAQRAADRSEAPAGGELAGSSAKPASQPSAAASSTPAATSAAAVRAAATTASEGSADIKVDASGPASGASVDTIAARNVTAEAGRAAPSHPALQSAPAATVQVYARFIERFDGRAQRFEVRLDPAELGRVDVRIEVGADRKVHAILAAHDSAALADLMRGQRALERALSDAGIDLSDGGVQFELADDPGPSHGKDQRSGAWGREEAHVWRAFSAVNVAVEGDAADLAATVNPYTRRAARLDLVA
jgi:flagellar hook-length control protein FliK